MYDALIFLTDGFEEIEALTPLDILRRGGCRVSSVSLTGAEWVTGSHDITMKADIAFEALTASGGGDTTADTFLILPGGPGTANYKKHEPLLAMLAAAHAAGGPVAAICAAPSVLGMLGILKGKTAVSYPSAEPELTGAVIGRGAVEKDGNIITSKSAATSLLFALEILQAIKGDETADTVRNQILEPVLKEAYRL